MSNLVAIVGRPNVGKSTLFNRMVGYKKAIIDDFSGVTRDRQYGSSDWSGKEFDLIDTGGFVPNSDDVFEAAIREQVEIAMEEASVIVFVVDAKTGVTDIDDTITRMLRRSKTPVICVVNKVDNSNALLEAQEFYSLGFKQTAFVSSINGSGTGEFLDMVIEHMAEDHEPYLPDVPKIAIVGQPNVGKSSIINALVGETRNIVTDIAGTTRDSIHTVYKKFNKELLLIDTAGVRKKAKVHENLEFYSVLRAIKAIEESDVVLLVIDATLGIESQDLSLFRLAERKKKGILIVVNKWDLVEKETNTMKEYTDIIKERLAPFTDIAVMFTSALEKTRILQMLDTAEEICANKNTKITTSKLNDFMQPLIEKFPPPIVSGKKVSIKYVTQLPLAFPAFAFYCNHPKYVKEPYKNFLENRIREEYNFTGVPMSIFIRKK